MDWDVIRAWFTLENISELTQQYRALGPIPGIVLPMLERFCHFYRCLFRYSKCPAFEFWWGFFFFFDGADRDLSCFFHCSKIWTRKAFPIHTKA